MIEQMKPSGIDWIGDVPESWETGRVKDYYSLQTGFTPDTSVAEYYDDENGYPWVSIADIDEDRLIYDTKSKISSLYIHEKHPIPSPAGSLLYSFKLSVGKVAFLASTMFTNEAIASFVNSPEVCLPYLYYSSIFIEQNANTNIYGAKILNQDLIKNAHIIFPPLTEQQRIAEHLDSQCSKLDSIIADLEKQIDTLQKYKKSLITETVTKGLDKSAPMKDSGVEWVGEIADKFTVKRLKYMVEIKDGTHDTPDYVEESDTTYPLITSKYIDYDTKTIDFSSAKHISKIDFENIYKRSNVEFGDIIMPMIGTIGNPVIVNTEEPFAIKNVALFKTSKNLTNAKYIFYQFYSYMLLEQFNIMARGGVQSFVSLEVLGNLLFVDCSQKEKEAIVNFLDQQCSALDKIIMEKQKELNLLNKHKKSLIYEYVTGKKRVTEVK